MHADYGRKYRRMKIRYYINKLIDNFICDFTYLGAGCRRFKSSRPDQIPSDDQDIINILPDKFEGNLTSSKWARLEKWSQDTALRDIGDLVKRNILIKTQGRGRSTSYALLDID